MAEESKKSRKERARNSTSVEELQILAEDEDKKIRLLVAENTNTPVTALEKLADLDKEDDFDVYQSALQTLQTLARSTNTPIPILEKLADCKHDIVRRYAAGNTNTPISLYVFLRLQLEFLNLGL